jgi:hypothetical protein
VRQSKTLSCERCAVLTTVTDAAARGWLNVVEPDASLLADLDGQGLLRRLCDAVSELPYR